MTFTVVSTFSGCGGSSLGYKLAGGDMRLAVEWDADAVQTYRANFPRTQIFHGDIAKLSVADVFAHARVREGELDIFDGSPPCQGFSTGKGKRNMFDDRNQLFREYVRLLRGLRPKVFVMENVSGMVKGPMKLIFVDILRELRASGYNVKARLLNAMYFNVPQSRERMIFIGVREDLGIDPSHPKAQSLPTTTARALKGCPIGEVPPFNDKYAKLWSRIPPGKSAAHVLNGSGFSSCVKLHPDKPSRTLPKTQTGRGFATIAHWAEPRAISIPEAKRLGSFPDSFVFTGDYSTQWARIGNCVPPNFMRAIAEHIRDSILTRIRAAA